MKKHYVLYAVLAALLSVLPSFAQVVVDYDHGASFSSYKTYTWAKVKGRDELWSDRIQSGIDSQLAAKGWKRVAEAGDATLVAFETTKDQPTMQTFYDNFGGGGFGGWGWRGFGGGGFGRFGTSTTTTENTVVGTLVVDVFDSKSHKLLWRGKESNDLSNNPSKNEKRLTENLAKMFRKFPPS